MGAPTGAGRLATSAVTGAGLDALRAAILAQAGLADDAEAGGAVLLSERQRHAAQAAATALAAGVDGLRAGGTLELVAVDVRAGLAALAALVGDGVGEDVLDRLFARFCIGK
ncbi:MAG: hypothetical protein R3B06_03715 [Kofleriaceae bacterium]